jgi:serine/threonine protein phosphatase PrpC
MGSDELSNTLVQLALSGAAADNITGIVLDGDVWNTDFYRSDN